MAETGSQRAYAKHRGVTHRAVQKAVERGRISLMPDGRVDFDKADAQWKANTVPSTSRKGRGARPGRGTLGEAMRKLALERARLVRLQYRKQRGELLDAAEVEQATFEMGRRVRERLLNVAARIGPLLDGQNAAASYDIVDREMKLVCDEIGGPPDEAGDARNGRARSET
jgi:hypothetical protein